MREELEAHVAMRAEHDGVDEAAARRRLGNMLHTRESMRRVWIAEWWDALRQDAHFTWRSWRRRPGVRAGGHPRAGARPRRLDGALRRARPRALQAAAVRGSRSPRLRRAAVTVAARGPRARPSRWSTRSTCRSGSTPPAPFQSVTAMACRRTCDIAEEQPEGLRCEPRRAQLSARAGRARRAGPRLRARGRRARGAAGRTHQPCAVGPALRRGSGSRRSDAESRSRSAIAPAGPHRRRPAARLRDAARDRRHPAPGSTASRSTRTSPFCTLDHGARTTQAGRDTRAREADAGVRSGRSMPAAAMLPGFREEWRVRPLHDRRVGDAARVAWLLIGAVAVFLLIACVNVTNLMLARVGERRREFGVRAAIGAGRMRLARLALAESLLLALAAGGIGLLVAFALLETFVAMAPPGIPGIADASIDLRVFVVAALLVVVTGTAIGVWPAVSVFRVGGLHGLRSTATSSPGARPRVRFALVTTQIALTLALLGGSALLLRSLWNVVNVPLGFDAERVVTLTAGLSRVRYPTVEHGAAFFEELLARARAMPGAVSVALSNAPPPPAAFGVALVGSRSKAGRSSPTRLSPRSASDRSRRSISRRSESRWSGAGRSRRPTGPASRPSRSTNPPSECCLPESRALGRRLRFPALPGVHGQPASAPVVHRRRRDRGRPKRSGAHRRAEPRDLLCRRGREGGRTCLPVGAAGPSLASHDGRSCRRRRLPPADRRRPRSEAARDHPDRR